MALSVTLVQMGLVKFGQTAEKNVSKMHYTSANVFVLTFLEALCTNATVFSKT